MDKEEKVRILLEVVRLIRYESYVDYLAARITSIDKEMREEFVDEYFKEVERYEARTMARGRRIYNKLSETSLEYFIAASGDPVYKQGASPPLLILMSVMARTHRTIAENRKN